MRRFLKRTTCFLLALVFVGALFSCAPKKAAPSGMSKLHVKGNQLVNDGGKPVVLSGWFQPMGAYFAYGSSQYYLNKDGGDNEAAVLDYMKDITNTFSDKKPKYSSNHGWYMNQCRICYDTDYMGDVAKGTYNFSGLQEATQKIVIPFIKYAASKGIYVTLDLNFTFTDGKCTTPENLVKYKQIWGYLASQPGIKSANNVMFELINEPINSYADGNWISSPDAPDFVDHWKALRDFQSQIISTIRAKGADNVIWCAGLGYNAFYSACAAYPITDPLKNYGYAVHWYPAYGAVYDNQAGLQDWWDDNVAPCDKSYPINITETAWFKHKDGDPQYWDLFNGSSANFGKKTKEIFNTAGNVSIVGGFNSNLLAPGPRSSMGDPTEGLQYDGDAQRDGMARFIFNWFYERAKSAQGKAGT